MRINIDVPVTINLEVGDIFKLPESDALACNMNAVKIVGLSSSIVLYKEYSLYSHCRDTVKELPLETFVHRYSLVKAGREI